MLKVKPVKVRLLEVSPEMEQGAQSSIVHPPSPDSILPKPHPGKWGCDGEAFLLLSQCQSFTRLTSIQE